MLINASIEALLVDEEAADVVWQASWDGELTYGAARIAWLMIAGLFWPDDLHADNPIYRAKIELS
jgi:hypothetical protein